MENEALIKIEQVDLIPDTHKMTHVSDLPSLGAAGESMYHFVQTIARPGGEGIYKVTFPKGFSDMTLSKFKNENAFMGSGVVDGSFKQARLNQLSFDPTQMFIAMALLNIQSKLNEIQRTQQEILDFMFDVQEAKLAGNLNVLNKAVDDYKLNCDNQTFIDQMRVQVGNIIRESSQGEKLYEKQIMNIIGTPESVHTITIANDLVNKLRRNLRNYHLAFYIRNYAEFLEVFLIGNFNGSNLKHVSDRFLSEEKMYDAMFSKCYEWSKNYLNSAIGKKIAPALRSYDELFARMLNHLPGNLHKPFEADAGRYVSAQTQIDQIQQDKKSGTTEFTETINLMECLRDKSVEMYLEDGKIYISNYAEVK